MVQVRGDTIIFLLENIHNNFDNVIAVPTLATREKINEDARV